MDTSEHNTTTAFATAAAPDGHNSGVFSMQMPAGDHLIAAFVGEAEGPTLIVVGGVHGNEAAGVRALERIAEDLGNRDVKFRGRVYFLAGNTRALVEGKRFIAKDLNRSWTSREMAAAIFVDESSPTDRLELAELDRLLDSILITARDEVYVVDLHSTSAGGIPFATVGDTLRNRRFARQFPITILLGIEEQLDGTMLEYLNNAGAVTLGFEGGQHTSEETIDNHEALVWMALVNAGILTKAEIPCLSVLRTSLERRSGSRVFEVRYRHPVAEKDDFHMRPGFTNFDPIRFGQTLADDRHGEVKALETGVILMPLYQKLGEDGFFIGRQVATFWLFVSEMLRRLNVQDLITILPGVRHDPADPSTLRVNTHVARLFPLQIFHLLGFRRRRWIGGELIVSRRKHDATSPFKR